MILRDSFSQRLDAHFSGGSRDGFGSDRAASSIAGRRCFALAEYLAQQRHVLPKPLPGGVVSGISGSE